MHWNDLRLLLWDFFDGGWDALSSRFYEIRTRINASKPPKPISDRETFWNVGVSVALAFSIMGAALLMPDLFQAMQKEGISGSGIQQIFVHRSPNWSAIEEEIQTEWLYRDRQSVSRQPIAERMLVSVDVEPVPINLYQIRKKIRNLNAASNLVYPEVVKVQILVDVKGNYVRHRNLTELPLGLIRQFNEQVAQLDFLPALRQSKPIPYWTEVTFHL